MASDAALPPIPASSPSQSPYPYAFAPDIIRAHQKDVYFQGLLTNQLSDLHRRLLGARSAHAWAPESRTLADLLYLCLTTLLGNRTLGEEYCGLVQVEAEGSGDGGRRLLPSLPRRAGYIAGSILLPYLLTKILPSVRARVRARLQRNLRLAAASTSTLPEDSKETRPRTTKIRTTTWSHRLQAYVLANLTTLTSPTPLVHAVSLSLFYFSGSYYELAKRLTGLRYIFTHRVDAESSEGGSSSSSSSSSGNPQAAGYEVLGVLLVIQMAVQTYLHIRSTLSTFSSFSSSPSTSASTADLRGREGSSSTTDVAAVSPDENAYASNNELLLSAMLGVPSTNPSSATSRIDVAAATHTPLPISTKSGDSGGGARARFDLCDDRVMRWIKGVQQRKCTLCLEELKDPAATQCGHVFCWDCIGDWVREKPECPLCRREAMVQHILPLRATRTVLQRT